MAIFYTRLYNRSLRTGLAVISPSAANQQLPIAKSIRAAEVAVNQWYDNAFRVLALNGKIREWRHQRAS
jgi:hypothetical protein